MEFYLYLLEKGKDYIEEEPTGFVNPLHLKLEVKDIDVYCIFLSQYILYIL